MAIQPAHLQNLLHGSEQLNKEIAAQSQSTHLQQLATGAEIAKKSKPENVNIHKIDNKDAQANKINEDEQSTTREHDLEEKEKKKGKNTAQQMVIDEHLGNKIDICQ